MKTLNKDYHNDGFYMPAEYDMHEGTLMIWPYRAGSWRFGAVAARKAFKEIIRNLARHEKVYLLVREEDLAEVSELASENVLIHVCETDDAWARDTGATFVVKNGAGIRRGIDWQFNAWGGTYDGLYASWEKDQEVAGTICRILGDERIDARHFVLEGGSIHVDGEGTILTTEECLLSPGRNPSMSREEIEAMLCEYLGGEKVIWLPAGIYNDETNGHVDNMAAFAGAGEVVLAWTNDEVDPQYERSIKALEVLERETDAKGRHFKVRKMLIPENPICISEEDLQGYTFEEGEDTREVGERLAASYVNYYVANGFVLVPQFGDENDKKAAELLAELFPDREIVPVDALEILAGGGNIHCITQQIPMKR